MAYVLDRTRSAKILSTKVRTNGILTDGLFSVGFTTTISDSSLYVRLVRVRETVDRSQPTKNSVKATSFAQKLKTTKTACDHMGKFS